METIDRLGAVRRSLPPRVNAFDDTVALEMPLLVSVDRISQALLTKPFDCFLGAFPGLLWRAMAIEGDLGQSGRTDRGRDQTEARKGWDVRTRSRFPVLCGRKAATNGKKIEVTERMLSASCVLFLLHLPSDSTSSDLAGSSLVPQDFWRVFPAERPNGNKKLWFSPRTGFSMFLFAASRDEFTNTPHAEGLALGCAAIHFVGAFQEIPEGNRSSS